MSSLSQTNLSRKVTFFLCLFLGFALAFTTIFAIIHEIGHLLGGGETISVSLKDWSHVTYKGEPTLGFLLAGWYFQFWFWCLVWGLFQFAGWKHFNILFDIVSGFAWGYVNGTVIQAMRSQDFIDIHLKLGFAVSETQIGWLTLTVPVLIVGWLIVKNCLKEMW